MQSHRPCVACVLLSAIEPSGVANLESAAAAALAQSGDAVQIVGGHGLVLLLDEAERREGESGVLAVAVLQHGGELVLGAPGLGHNNTPPIVK